MVKNIIDYISEKINANNLIEKTRENKIEVEEKDEGARLTKVIINSKNYNMIGISLDENNLDEKASSFPFLSFICNSADAIIFASHKSRKDCKKLYIFHIELKSERVEGDNILKKHLFSKQCSENILKMLEIKSEIDGFEEGELRDLEIIERMIVFRIGNINDGNSRNNNKYKNYDTQKIKNMGKNLLHIRIPVSINSSREHMLDSFIPE